MSDGIATAQLQPDALDTYLAFPVWDEPVVPSATEPVNDEDMNARQAQIRKLLARQRGGWLGDAPFMLRHALSLLATLGRIPTEKRAALFDICDALSRERLPCVADFSQVEEWQSAIRLVRRAPSRHNNDDPGRFSRGMAVARAIRNVEAAGFPVTINAFGSGFEPDTLRRACQSIDERVRKLGGYQFIKTLFRWYVANRRIYYGSLLFGRQVDQWGNPRDPAIPWHYLYNLAVRHLDAMPEPGIGPQDFDHLITFARNIAAVFDVERYSLYEAMHGISHSGFHDALLERVTYDELFAFQQWQPGVAPALLRILLEEMERKGAHIPLTSVENWLAWAEAVLHLARDGELIVCHPTECVSPEVSAELSTTLFQALAIPIGELNRDFLTPSDTPARNAPRHPFYAYPSGLHFMPPKALVARGLFEGITRLLRKHNANAENWLGEVLEEMTAQAVGQIGHRPKIVRQKYRIPGQRKRDADFDIDVADQTPRHFFLLECKKKALTSPARAGNTLSATLDFARAFLQPLVQANRHEKQLRSAEGLTLLDGRNFRLAGRNVQRIAVTMTDHGSMLDRPFLRVMITALWSATLNAVNPHQQEDADEINKTLRELVTGIQGLSAMANGDVDQFNRVYVGGCWFLSVDILYFLCRGSDDLWVAIAPLGSITNGTSDVMTELSNHDRSGLLTGLRASIRAQQAEEQSRRP